MQYNFTAGQRLAFFLTKNHIFNSIANHRIYLQSYVHPHPADPLEVEAEGLKDELDAEMKAIRDSGIQMLFLGEQGFPKGLESLDDAPVMLFVRSTTPAGELFGTTDRRHVAVVGTRDVDTYGRRATERVVSLFRDGVIVSGLAIGVDIEAHRQALQNGQPTIAVLPTGLDAVYPVVNRSVAETIAATEGCALVSPFAPDTAPIAMNFILRNHVMAALSDTVVVTESKAKGGAVLTARLASDYGRMVYAVPGRLDDTRSEGCNYLISAGFAEIFTLHTPAD